ncbi:hypothetical protein RUND412_007994 [Rhizina undulata]
MLIKRRDIEFKNFNGDTLRGWFYPVGKKAPAIIITHGFACTKEMYLDVVAERYQAAGIAALVYDQRCFGASDGLPRLEIEPFNQAEDVVDAISYLETLTDEVNPDKIALWGYSYSGGHAINVAALDRRVKAIVLLFPMVSGVRVMKNLVRADHRAPLAHVVREDRKAIMRGEAPQFIQVHCKTPLETGILVTADAHEFFKKMNATVSPNFENKVTLQTAYHLNRYNAVDNIKSVGPTPMLMFVGSKDNLCQPDVLLDAYAIANEPKEIQVVDSGHFDAFEGPLLEKTMATQLDFLKRKLVDA